VDGIVAGRVHHEPILCVDKAYAEWINASSSCISGATLTFLIPNALMSPMLPTSPRQALRGLRLPWRKCKVEEMVQ
jgi:hypothetical protein